MTIQHLVELVLAGLVVGVIFGGPVMIGFGVWLIRRNERRPWLVTIVPRAADAGN